MPNALGSVIETMVKKDREQRFATLAEVADQLRRFACGPESPSLLGLLPPPKSPATPLSDHKAVFQQATELGGSPVPAGNRQPTTEREPAENRLDPRRSLAPHSAREVGFQQQAASRHGPIAAGPAVSTPLIQAQPLTSAPAADTPAPLKRPFSARRLLAIRSTIVIGIGALMLGGVFFAKSRVSGKAGTELAVAPGPVVSIPVKNDSIDAAAKDVPVAKPSPVGSGNVLVLLVLTDKVVQDGRGISQELSTLLERPRRTAFAVAS